MENRYLLLTGCSSGIGKATTLKLLSKGYFVIGLDINQPNLTHEKFKFIKCDISNLESVNESKKEVLKITKYLDGLLDIAGIFMLQPVVEGNPSDLHKIFDINFFGPFNINQAYIPLIKKEGRILLFTSEVARYSPQPFNGYYALSKIAVDKYGDVLRRELNYLGIKVIKVQCGAIKTKLLDGVNSKYEATLNSTKYYKAPLTKLKYLMDGEINKQVDPSTVANKLVSIIEKKHPKILYKIKNSFKLRFLNCLPEKLQDFIYVNVIK